MRRLFALLLLLPGLAFGQLSGGIMESQVGVGGVGLSPVLTGLVLGNGAVYAPYAGTSCTTQFPRALNASGVATCETVTAADILTALASSTTITSASSTALVVRAGTSGTLSFGGNNTSLWSSTSAGGTALYPVTSNANDIGAAANRVRSITVGTSIVNLGDNSQSIALLRLTELTTIAAAATTDTTIQMPAGAIILGVSVRVTVVIPTATTFTVGDSGSAARFSTAAVSTAATSTDRGTKAGAYYNASALSVRITPDATPAANTGRVRVTIDYLLVTPPTSYLDPLKYLPANDEWYIKAA